MAVTAQSTLSNTYQEFFSKKLLQHEIQSLKFNSFAKQADLPARTGAKQIAFFRPEVASAANVQTLSEGTPISAFRNVTYAKVYVALAQYGEAAKITDIVTMTELFDALQQSIETMSEECALHADTITRNVIQAFVTSANQKRYAQGLANYAAVAGATVANSKVIMKDILAAITRLKNNRAPTVRDGKYAVIAPPSVTADLQQDTQVFIPLATYSGSETSRIVNGEIGTIYGGLVVENTNAFVEDASGSEGTFDGAPSGDAIYTTVITGKDSYGTPKISTGQKVPVKDKATPQIIINDKPDKSDPLNQFITAGWKSYWAALGLNERWICTLRGKSEFEN